MGDPEEMAKRLEAPHYWMSGSADGHEGENDAPREAASMIRILAADNGTLRAEVADQKRMRAEEKAKIITLREQLRQREARRPAREKRKANAAAQRQRDEDNGGRDLTQLADCNRKIVAQREEIARLGAKIAEALAAERWQPIETAPRDGTRIDVWVPDTGRVTDAAFLGQVLLPDGRTVHQHVEERGMLPAIEGPKPK